jgi:hypothetical protein
MRSELVDEVLQLGDLWFLALSSSDAGNQLLSLRAIYQRVTVELLPMIEDALGESSSGSGLSQL